MLVKKEEKRPAVGLIKQIYILTQTWSVVKTGRNVCNQDKKTGRTLIKTLICTLDTLFTKAVDGCSEKIKS